MSPLPSAWRLLHPGRVALHDLREELAEAQRCGIHVFVDVLEVDPTRSIGASPPCADPNCVSYRVGPRVFLRPGSDEELLAQLRNGLALLDPVPSEANHATR